ncbi:Flp pilus assembly complex ATPase component TadA [Burkholderiaceae bacterium DAT-1]|nr:Flp pilus assembly complex ATPase component TadA [Burkholderiaceae bacterium DAT-1]
MTSRPTVRFGESLVAEGILHPDQLHLALTAQRTLGKPIGETLIELGFSQAQDIWPRLAKRLGNELVTTLDTCIGEMPFSPHLARRYQVWPARLDTAARTMTLAMSRPQDTVVLDMLTRHLHRDWLIEPALCDPLTLAQALSLEQRPPMAWQDLDAPGILDDCLGEAHRLRASDIHFEPGRYSGDIRMRIDGVLHLQHSASLDRWPQLINRIKTLAGMDITDTRHPQDGRFSWQGQHAKLEIRVSSLPTIDGEKLVLRLADLNMGPRSLASLGLAPPVQSALELAMRYPSGLILVCGPTGSGKTSTLHALVATLSSPGIHIATLEDPVEVRLPHIRQTAISEQLNFPDGIRALMRQDPDIILIGEIRDAETAAMAMRAAMTGHLVLSTVHASSTRNAVLRMEELGISTRQLASELKLILSQRLVRTQCPHCFGAGCSLCQHRGFKGRTILAECLIPDCTALDSLHPQHTLQDDAQRILRAGLTTAAEIERVTGWRP